MHTDKKLKTMKNCKAAQVLNAPVQDPKICRKMVQGNLPKPGVQGSVCVFILFNILTLFIIMSVHVH